MADKSLKLSIVVAAQDLASGKLSQVRQELAGMGKAGAIASTGLTRIVAVGNRAGTAFGTLKSRVSGFASALSPLLGLGGLFGVAKVFTDTIGKAEAFGVATQKIASVTNMATEEASAYVDVLDKYGISTDQAVQITGLLLKNYAGLIQNTKKASAFEALYGVSIRKANGQQLTAAELLDKTNEFFNSNATATDKAAFAAKLYGRNWQQLLPILSLTRAEFKKQNAEALKLTPQQLKAALDLKKAQQDFNDELGDTETLVGVEILPSITKLLHSMTSFLSAHRGDIINAVKGGAQLAGQIADAFGAVVSGLSGAWNAVPAPLRDLLLKGFVADRTIKFLFGFDPAKAILGGITGLFSKAMGIRANVVNVSGGTVTGTGAGVGTGKGGGSKLGNAVAAVSIVGDAFALWQQWTQSNEQSTAQANDLLAQSNAWQKTQPKRDDLVSGLAAVDKGIADIRNNPLLTLVQGEALNRLQTMDANIRAQIAAIDSLKPHIDAIAALKIAVTVSGLTGNTGRSRVGGGTQNRGGGSSYVDKGGGRGGGRASGGPVWPGGTYTVGERGMEMLRLDRSGHGYVTPIGGRQGVNVTIINRQPHISARESMNADRQWRRVTSGNGSGVTIR